jgi:hypothetical protein
VSFNVVLGGVPCMLSCVGVVSMREMRVMSGLLVVAFRVVLGGCMVVACSVFVMLRCLSVVLCCFVRHGETSGRSKQRASKTQTDYQ